MTAAAPAGFLSLPSELRNQIYELVLLHQEPIDPQHVHRLDQRPTPGLLRLNKIVHNEASSLFYSQNRFDFTGNTAEDVDSFLKRIGSNNAVYMRHIVIDFPRFDYLLSYKVGLKKYCIDLLTAIRSACPNLHTLVTSLDSTDLAEVKLERLFNHDIVDAALQLVDAHFRTIPSLQDIIVEVCKHSIGGAYSDYYVRKRMESHGWKITSEGEDDDDWETFSESDDDSYGDDFYGDFDTDDDDELGVLRHYDPSSRAYQVLAMAIGLEGHGPDVE